MIAVTPVVHVAHRLGWLGYEWVNRCLAARRPDLFNPLYQHRWYGADIGPMPDAVTLCGIGYEVSVAEGTVTFVSEYFRTNRVTFHRDPYAGVDLWYVEVSGNTPAVHVVDAYGWVAACFGGSHVVKHAAVRHLATLTATEGATDAD
jgi:hypothetical protein